MQTEEFTIICPYCDGNNVFIRGSTRDYLLLTCDDCWYQEEILNEGYKKGKVTHHYYKCKCGQWWLCYENEIESFDYRNIDNPPEDLEYNEVLHGMELSDCPACKNEGDDNG